MNLQVAETKAKYLTEVRKIDHVVIKSGDEFEVCMKENYSGKPVKTIVYESAKDDKPTSKAGKTKAEPKKIQDIPDLRNPSGEEVLSGNGDE